MEAFLFLSSLRRSQALMRLLGHRQTYLFEYFTVQDSMASSAPKTAGRCGSC